jgi:hypothetical protein
MVELDFNSENRKFSGSTTVKIGDTVVGAGDVVKVRLIGNLIWRGAGGGVWGWGVFTPGSHY